MRNSITAFIRPDAPYSAALLGIRHIENETGFSAQRKGERTVIFRSSEQVTQDHIRIVRDTIAVTGMFRTQRSH
jgi:hypothetical protein